MDHPSSSFGVINTAIKQDNDVFEFETESLPLNQNKDYEKLINCLNVLLSLRSNALEGIGEVLKIQEEAMANPLDFYSKLRNGELNLPGRPDIPDIPQIDWFKYKIQPGEALRPETRPKNREFVLEVDELSSDSKADVGKISMKVKEREKSTTFNKPWTEEEQLRLEELLQKYPGDSNSNEAQRFSKIAKELGNRTVSQVTSRCQKYFIKLQKLGLPIPGRPPRRPDKLKNPKNKKRLISRCTFFPRAYPLMVNDDQPGTSYVQNYKIKTEMLDSDDSLQADVASGEMLKLGLLRRVRSHLAKHGSQPVAQPGYSCKICGEEPLKGTRWHCMQCENVDICSPCLISQLEGEGGDEEDLHPVDHPLASYRPAPISATLPLADKDYHTSTSTSYNYLDSSFHPE